MTQHLSKIIPRNKRVLFLGLLLGIVFWIAEGVLHIVTFNKWDIAEAMLPHETHEFWIRSFVTCMFIGFGFYIQLIINKLYESRERYQALFKNAPDAIFLADTESGQIIDANPAASQLLLRTHEEITKLHQSQVHPPAKEKDSKSIFSEHVEKIVQGQKQLPVEHVAFRSDGVEVPVEIMSQIVHIGGRRIVQGVFRDVTERKKAEIELKNSHERFMTVLDSLDALVYVSDMATNEILFTNKYGRNIWGDITGKTCWKALQKSQDGPCEFCTNDRLLDGNGEPTGIHRWEFQNTVDNQWYDCHDQAIRWTDGRLVRMEVATNTTERNMAEEKLAENQAQLHSLVSQLTMTEESERKELAGILHDDLIQRLVMCKMRLDELGKAKTLVSRDNSLDEIGESIREMIKDTRTLTFDLCSPVLYDIGLEAAIRDWLDREVHGKHDTTFEFTDDGQQRQLSEGVRVMLYRAVRELSTNIIKHSKAQKAKISVRNKSDATEMIVEDNGVGVMIDSSMSDSSDRGGLGLFGIRERLKHFGASVNIESEADAGTRITISVPLNR